MVGRSCTITRPQSEASALYADLHARSVGQRAVDELDDTVAHDPLTFHLVKRTCGRAIFGSGLHTTAAFVHGIVREAIGVLVALTKNMLDLKPFKVVDQLLCLVVERS